MALASPPPLCHPAKKSLSFKSRELWMQTDDAASGFISGQLPQEIRNSPRRTEAFLQFRRRVYVELEAVNDYTALQSGLLFPHIDHSTLLRFLKARKYDADKAFEMLANYIAFRVTEYPCGSVQIGEIRASLGAGKVQVLRHADRQGNACLVVALSRHNARDVSASETERFIVYCLDKIVSTVFTGDKSLARFTIFGDLRGVGWSNLDVSCTKRLFALMQNYFPERLALLFNWCPPPVFSLAHKLVMPLCDPNTRRKVVMANNQSELARHFDPASIPCSLGGTGGEDLLIPIEDVTKGAVLF